MGRKSELHFESIMCVNVCKSNMMTYCKKNKIKFYTRAKFQNLHTILGASIIAVSSHPIRALNKFCTI